MAVWSRSRCRPLRRSDCAASAVSVSRLTDRRRQRGPSAGAAAHAARHLSSKIRTPGASLGVRSIEARQILARFSDDASFPTYLFLYSLLYFGDVIYCKYPSSKYRREYRFPLCEACLYIVKKKTRAAFPLFTPSHEISATNLSFFVARCEKSPKRHANGERGTGGRYPSDPANRDRTRPETTQDTTKTGADRTHSGAEG